MSASEALAFLSRYALAVMMTPLTQKPHCTACVVDESLLDRMGLLDGAEPFECRDLRTADGADRSDARTNRFAFDHHRARSALAEAAAKLRPAQGQIVAQDKEQGSVGIDIHPMTLSVDAKCESRHSVYSNPNASITLPPAALTVVARSHEKHATDDG